MLSSRLAEAWSDLPDVEFQRAAMSVEMTRNGNARTLAASWARRHAGAGS